MTNRKFGPYPARSYDKSPQTWARRAGEPLSYATLRAEQPLTYWKLRAEPTIWTERMLTTLLEGVRGGKWYSLMDKIHPERTLNAAFCQVAANRGAAGVDHVTVTMFDDHREANLKKLSEDLCQGTYRPQ